MRVEHRRLGALPAAVHLISSQRPGHARPRSLVLLLLVLVAALSVIETTSAEEAIDFNRDVRPILSDKCFRCHGPDEQGREAGLRLDRADAAAAVIAAGKPDESELVRRIETADESERMPPHDANLSLSPEQRQTLRRWIAAGAEYQSHWALAAPQAPALPDTRHKPWARNEIDLFIAARLELSQLDPSREASREQLLRRVSLDLTGLPPTLDELDAFLADARPDAYEHAVDRLLASPHYGERMAIKWLDAARYADTNGYFGDEPRSVWPWRQWVIDAYNANMPFDEFTRKQLAGDLLPSPTRSDLIATGFNRNHMANNETGLIDEEYRVEYVADRLETTATTWMGLTVGCARCHDHKYDPISQREFYQLFACFNNGPETGLITAENPPPLIELPSSEQQHMLGQAKEDRVAAERQYAPLGEAVEQQLAQWEPSAEQQLGSPPQQDQAVHCDFEDRIVGTPLGTTIKYQRGIFGKAAQFDATQHAELPSGVDLDQPWTIGVWSLATNSLACPLSIIEPTGRRRGLEVLWQKGRWQVNLVHHWGVHEISVTTRAKESQNAWHHLVITYDGSRGAAGLHVFVDGARAEVEIQRDTLSGTINNNEPLRIARRDKHLGFYGVLDELRILQHNVVPEEVQQWYWSERLLGILAVPRDERSTADRDVLLAWYIDRHASQETRAAWQRVKDAQQAEAAIQATVPKTLVMEELPMPRTTAVLERGQYDKPGEVVQPDVPAALPEWPADAPRNRRGLAEWLVGKSHPLTARVAVNRLWQHCFGEGLVRTMNDFGSQGDLPSHPELLDWLAVRYMHAGWDTKAMLRLIVTSATYRQSSAATPLRLEQDPDNRLLARGPRYRLSAEVLRDQALAISGLLVPQIGGPSVKPYQPAGLWEEVSYNGDHTYVVDQGAGLWRRSLYTFWKRQAPPPALLTFDSPTREKCTVQRARTNTPLQALVLLNDITYIEAARSLAAWTLATSGSDAERLAQAFRRVTSRAPYPEELDVLMALLEQQRTRFVAEPQQAAKLIQLGESTAGRDLDPLQLAAWTVTLHTLLNLDEVIVRR